MATASTDLTIVDNRLFKAICLHQILNPNHRNNRYYTIAFFAFMILSFVGQIIQLVGLYFAVNDLQRFALTNSMVSIAFLCLFKGFVLVINSDRLRDGLEAARYDFTCCGFRDQRVVRQARATLSTILFMFVVLFYVSCFLWMLTPLFLMDDYLAVINLDGSVSRYRITIFNIWLPVPVTVYNTPTVWALIYCGEGVICFFSLFSWLLFDSYVMTMFFTFNAQFRVLSASCATIGHRELLRSPLQHATDTPIIKTDDNHILNCYDELINCIKDNQKIIKKFDEFFDVIKPVVLLQIFIGSYTVITLVFLTSLMYLMGFSIISVTILKSFCGFLLVTSQLLMYCYIFNRIETEKSAVNFGLYSSNWTALDLKFKKTLLLAMNMNSAHRRVMKVSQKSIINLEMFASVMNMTYSIVSVLLNSRIGK